MSGHLVMAPGHDSTTALKDGKALTSDLADELQELLNVMALLERPLKDRAPFLDELKRLEQ